MITSYRSETIASTSLSVTSYALISGCMSYVGTFGLLTRMRSSPSYCFSTPPLKKNVTCAYFSVSAMRSCLRPFSEMYSPKVFASDCGLNATCTFGIVASYCVMQTYVSGKKPFFRSKPEKSGSTNVRVISRARSGRKLKKMTESFA